MTTPRPHLTTRQLAERFGRSYSWVKKHIDNPAYVPTPIRIGGCWMFRVADIEVWESKRKLGSRSLSNLRIA